MCLRGFGFVRNLLPSFQEFEFNPAAASVSVIEEKVFVVSKVCISFSRMTLDGFGAMFWNCELNMMFINGL